VKGRFHFSSIIFISLLIAQGCGGGSSSNTATPVTNIVPDSTPTELEGTWTKSCSPENPGEPDTLYETVTITFSGNQFSSDIHVYDDINCLIPNSAHPNPTASGLLRIGDPVQASDGTWATELDSHIEYYGGAPFDIDEYGIYLIVGDVLYVEDPDGSGDGTSPQSRFLTLDYTYPLLRQ
jgi:hypothetical protein